MVIRILQAHIRKIFYIFVIVMMTISAYTEYLTWLNPLNLKPEENPKQHDGSQEFKPPIDWESSIQPLPDTDGVRRYLPPDKLDQHGKESEPDK